MFCARKSLLFIKKPCTLFSRKTLKPRLSRTCDDKQNLLFWQQGTGNREQKIRLRVNGNKEYILPHYGERALSKN